MKPSHLIRSRKDGFTMLEIMVAVMILVMVSIGVFKFVQNTIRAISESERASMEDIALERFFSFVQEQINSISPRSYESLLSESLKINGIWQDNLEWKSRAGLGVLTRSAAGEFRVKLTLQPVEKGSRDYEVGLRRIPWSIETSTGVVKGAVDKDATWVPLLRNVSALRFQFFDTRLGTWIPEWKDPDARPTLVKIELWRKGSDFPLTHVVMVPASKTQQ